MAEISIYKLLLNGQTKQKGGGEMNKIKCVVEECQYNSGNSCTASSIDVASSGSMSVSTADDTACKTFKPNA